jgi:anaerobic selenocysteine-containing dehydrogenase
MPNQVAVIKGLEREDLFTVVFDQVPTDTAQYADILLPSSTFLEQEELKKSYGSYVFQYYSPVIDSCGESKSNPEVFAMLGRAMGWSDHAFQETTEDYLRRAAGAVRGLGRTITLEELREKRLLFFDFPGPNPVQFETSFPWTQDGKINLAPATLGERPYEFIEDKDILTFPLALISPATNKTISSSLAEYTMPVLYVTMNPAEAGARNLTEGSVVRVFNQYGEVHVVLQIRPEVRPGVVVIPKGAWRKASRNGFTSNALSPDTLGTAGGACFNDARVEVERLSAGF